MPPTGLFRIFSAGLLRPDLLLPFCNRDQVLHPGSLCPKDRSAVLTPFTGFSDQCQEPAAPPCSPDRSLCEDAGSPRPQENPEVTNQSCRAGVNSTTPADGVGWVEDSGMSQAVVVSCQQSSWEGPGDSSRRWLTVCLHWHLLLWAGFGVLFLPTDIN